MDGAEVVALEELVWKQRSYIVFCCGSQNEETPKPLHTSKHFSILFGYYVCWHLRISENLPVVLLSGFLLNFHQKRFFYD